MFFISFMLNFSDLLSLIFETVFFPVLIKKTQNREVHITPVVTSPHWLSVYFRIDFKIVLMI